ncbi:S41 family peptidase [Psychroserpens ponticola]|uniref:S41 family peptidase n=1 Tax=Psychroserpens ponticola TaxID=2932268 RepID=A0ABY7S0R5_9FLAO|nr:S41 family peptidase [Psychroserpens ponticola]WCO02996.1 S41 family peptidase [Psychroserpens ponticola]
MLKQLTLLSLLCCFLSVQSQDQPEFCEQLQAIKALVKKEHFKPKPIDDSLSVGVYKLFLAQLDDKKRFFIQKDIDVFEKDRLQLDDYIANNDCAFIDEYSEILVKRIENAKQIIHGFSKSKFDYSGKDTLRFAPDAAYTYLDDNTETINYWSKRIRYNILFELIEQDSIIENLSANFKKEEKEIKPKIIQKELCKLEELQNKNGGLSQFVKEAFLNAYVAFHDPNSTFFNATDKTTYVNSLSNDQLSFGIITNKNDKGNIVIAHITPGSPAFINGDFETNDIIKSLQANDIILETYCVSNDDIVAFINDENNTTITFKIKKQNGTLKDIELTKTKTKIEDNTVTGYLLKDKANIGYISINNFYSDFESPNGLGVANDVAKELYKLQKENIDALILDLRFNGGGSMKEAADLSGMFINRGPLSILKYGNGDTFTIKDTNRGSLFMKPIVILINNFSASASEFFAAAMQDYNRAIVVGSTSHGKASAQVILPLDEDSQLGFSKLTVEKFYRITGQSHQSVGVIPDIQLPNLYDNFKTEERFSSFALDNDSIEPTLKYIKLKALPLKALETKNRIRVGSNLAFDAVKSLNTLIIDNYFELKTEYPLTLQNVYKNMNAYHSQWELFSDSINNNTSTLVVSNTSSTIEVLSYNNEQKEVNEAFLKTIQNDIYISEAHYILLDLLNLNITD